MNVFKSNIKILSWLDIVIGAVFLILTLIGSLVIFSLTEFPAPGLFDISFSFLIGLLMIFSGYILIESKTNISKIIGWLTSIFGFFNIIVVILNIVNFVPYDAFSIMIGLILGVVTFILMIVSGYYLRKHF